MFSLNITWTKQNLGIVLNRPKIQLIELIIYKLKICEVSQLEVVWSLLSLWKQKFLRCRPFECER